MEAERKKIQQRMVPYFDCERFVENRYEIECKVHSYEFDLGKNAMKKAIPSIAMTKLLKF